VNIEKAKRGPVVSSSEVKSQKSLNEDLATLQSRIMGLQKKIKDDEVSSRRIVRENSA
jgi:hypothetical protein